MTARRQGGQPTPRVQVAPPSPGPDRGLPLWSLLVLAVLLVPVVLVQEPVFGSGVGIRAAGAGAVAGLLVAGAGARWRWDTLTTVAVALGVHFLLGGWAALPSTLHRGVLPGAQTLQALLVQPVHAWKDLLTLTPPAASYTGPAVLPWVVGLVCSLAAGTLTVRRGWAVAGTAPIAVMGLVGIAWGPSGTFPATWPVAVWGGGVLAWWAWVARRRRVVAGEDVLVGRRAVRALHTSGASTGTAGTTGRRVTVVHTGRQVLAAVLTVGVAAGLAVPLAAAWAPGEGRIVLRDLVSPPLDVQDYPSPLSSFRHYTTDLADRTLVQVSDLPEGARVRLAVMDTYDGIAFGMSDPATSGRGGYVRVGTQFPVPTPVPGAVDTQVEVTTEGLLGPWVPLVGVPRSLQFTGPDAAQQQAGLHLDQQADAALTTAPSPAMSYSLSTSITPVWSDGQLAGVSTPPDTSTPDTNVPDGVAELAQQVAATEQTPLGKARAIERFLSREGFFSNSDTAQSRPGHRADRLARMVDGDQMIGDDEQYAPLMALMLHTLGIPARVVMGAHPEASSGGHVDLRGSDIHAWVEVEFEGVGWAHFDPTPPKDQVPRTDVPRPRSVPRPQVLQPPEPPEEPAELPPSTADRPAEPGEEESEPFPWVAVLGVSGGLLLVLGPVLALVLSKWARRRRRRREADPARAVEGSWREVLDLARDAGLRIPADLTRQESAWFLSSSLWAGGPGRVARSRGDEGDAVDPGPAVHPGSDGAVPTLAQRALAGAAPATVRRGAEEGDGQDGRPASPTAVRDRELPGDPGPGRWTPAEEEVPATVVLARIVDSATFSEEGPAPGDVALAWEQEEYLRRDLARGAGPWTRLRRRLSVRSLWTGRSGRTGRKVRKGRTGRKVRKDRTERKGRRWGA